MHGLLGGGQKTRSLAPGLQGQTSVSSNSPHQLCDLGQGTHLPQLSLLRTGLTTGLTSIARCGLSVTTHMVPHQPRVAGTRGDAGLHRSGPPVPLHHAPESGCRRPLPRPSPAAQGSPYACRETQPWRYLRGENQFGANLGSGPGDSLLRGWSVSPAPRTTSLVTQTFFGNFF